MSLASSENGHFMYTPTAALKCRWQNYHLLPSSGVILSPPPTPTHRYLLSRDAHLNRRANMPCLSLPLSVGLSLGNKVETLQYDVGCCRTCHVLSAPCAVRLTCQKVHKGKSRAERESQERRGHAPGNPRGRSVSMCSFKVFSEPQLTQVPVAFSGSSFHYL